MFTATLQCIKYKKKIDNILYPAIMTVHCWKCAYVFFVNLFSTFIHPPECRSGLNYICIQVRRHWKVVLSQCFLPTDPYTFIQKKPGTINLSVTKHYAKEGVNTKFRVIKISRMFPYCICSSLKYYFFLFSVLEGRISNGGI